MAYYELLRATNTQAQPLEKLCGDYSESTKEWYHLLCHEDDIPGILVVPNLTFYTFCRCHLICDDGSVSHEHWHALCHFTEGKTLLGLKKRLQRKGMKHNSKTTFKKIFCFDHAVGVVRYIACEDGQKNTRRGADGLQNAPHTHYSRSVIDQSWLHSRGRICSYTRTDIENKCSKILGLEWRTINVVTYENGLHDFQTCKCDRSKIGMKKKEEANLKRKAYYATDAGIEMKKKYKEKSATKNLIIKQLTSMGKGKKAEFSRESIMSLLNLL